MAASATVTYLEVEFDRDMDTLSGVAADMWSWRRSNVANVGGGGTWVTARIYRISIDFSGANAGANVYSYDASLGDIMDLDGLPLQTIINQPY